VTGWVVDTSDAWFAPVVTEEVSDVRHGFAALRCGSVGTGASVRDLPTRRVTEVDTALIPAIVDENP
jgi:hypothetical protein